MGWFGNSVRPMAGVAPENRPPPKGDAEALAWAETDEKTAKAMLQQATAEEKTAEAEKIKRQEAKVELQKAFESAKKVAATAHSTNASLHRNNQEAKAQHTALLKEIAELEAAGAKERAEAEWVARRIARLKDKREAVKTALADATLIPSASDSEAVRGESSALLAREANKLHERAREDSQRQLTATVSEMASVEMERGAWVDEREKVSVELRALAEEHKTLQVVRNGVQDDQNFVESRNKALREQLQQMRERIRDAGGELQRLKIEHERASGELDQNREQLAGLAAVYQQHLDPTKNVLAETWQRKQQADNLHIQRMTEIEGIQVAAYQAGIHKAFNLGQGPASLKLDAATDLSRAGQMVLGEAAGLRS